ncbi:RHS repeat-associated core domain-containing protein [Micromonospora sp. NBC_01638]|nr:RHS repeat-associated core domain-containing protein [Micromonospora sp. NBC_01638]
MSRSSRHPPHQAQRLAGQAGNTVRSTLPDSAGTASAYKWQVRNFNERYQPTGVNYVIPPVEAGLDQTYVYGYGYSQFTGAPTTIAYPAGGGLVNEQLTTDYDATTGMPVRLDTSLTGFVGTVATATYTAYGERKGSIYKVPGNSSYTQETVYRDEATRRVNRTIIERSTVAGTVSDRQYTYQDAGNIKSITETPQVGQADAQCFRDDALGRLTTAWTPKAGVSCDTDPALANLGGPAPYWQDWTVNDTGSRRTETSNDSSGKTTRSYAVPEGGPGVVRPHAVTNVKTVTPSQAILNHKYEYDKSGNTACRPAAHFLSNNCLTATNSQTLGWDAEGKLATVSFAGNTIETNIYDTDGVRLIRRDTTGTTLYLPGQEIRLQGGVKTGTRYYDLAGTTIASRTASSAITDLTWLYNDHQGTQQVAINAGTQKVDIRRQTPYGAPRGSNPTWPNSKGFVGGDNDPTGLINIGARQYDRALGRFISVDPLMDLADPQQWNAYSYANNTPATSSDPTGLIPADCLEFDCRGYDSRPIAPGDKNRGAGGCPSGCGTQANIDWGDSNGKSSTKKGHKKKIGAVTLLDAFFAGKAGDYRFTDGDFFAEQLRKDAFLQNSWGLIAQEVYSNERSGEIQKSLGDASSLPTAIKELLVILEFLKYGYTDGNLEVAMMGSYHIMWKATNVKANGAADVELVITNRTSAASMTRVPGFGYIDGYDDLVRPARKRLDDKLPTQTQTVVLRGQIPAVFPRTGTPPPSICRNAVTGGGSC